MQRPRVHSAREPAAYPPLCTACLRAFGCNIHSCGSFASFVRCRVLADLVEMLVVALLPPFLLSSAHLQLLAERYVTASATREHAKLDLNGARLDHCVNRVESHESSTQGTDNATSALSVH